MVYGLVENYLIAKKNVIANRKSIEEVIASTQRGINSPEAISARLW
jgi:hypothetical protein